MSMISIKVSGTDHVKELAAALKLPTWLVEAVIIEYLPCRRFLEAEASILFDFERVTQQDFESVASPYILLSGITLFHNVTLDVLQTRMTRGIGGLPLSTLVEHPYLSIPQGKASASYIPMIFNPITAYDWKLSLTQYAVIYDRETEEVFQWKLIKLPGEASESYDAMLLGYNPELYTADQVRKLREIREKISHIFSEYEKAGDANSLVASQERLENCYQQIEKLWVPMRRAVLAYHEQNKSKPETTHGYTKDPPPTLTVYDQFDLQKIQQGTSRKRTFTVRTYIEPLFFRAAYRAYASAAEVKTKINGDTGTSSVIAEEIEAAAECIILSATCLEAYINGFVEDHIEKNDERNRIKRMEFTTKWLFVPAILGKPDCFNTSTQPFKNFAKLAQWRNDDLIHYKHEFQLPVPHESLGKVSKVYSICNADNSYMAIETVHEMVTRINEHLGFPIPAWVQVVKKFSSSWLDPIELPDRDAE